MTMATAAQGGPTPRRRRGGLTLAILLVGIGVVLLLQNLGLLSSAFWRQYSR